MIHRVNIHKLVSVASTRSRILPMIRDSGDGFAIEETPAHNASNDNIIMRTTFTCRCKFSPKFKK